VEHDKPILKEPTPSPAPELKAPTAPLRVGLAGLGRFGRLHASVLASLPGVELTALADPEPQRLRQAGERHGVKSLYTDALSLIAGERLDAVVLATPDEQHPEQTSAALEIGQHVFVEKPLAQGWRQAEELKKLATRRGRLLQVGMILRYETSHRWLHQQIREGRMGELVSIRCQRNCSRSSYSAIADHIHTVFRTLIHDLDLLLWFSRSRVTSVTALEVRRGDHLAPLGCFALLRLADGCVAQLESSWTVPEQAPANVLSDHWHGCIDAELAVVGTERTTKLRGLQSPLQIWSDRELQRPDTTLWPELGGQVSGALREELSDFCRCARAGRPSAIADLDQAVQTMRMAEALIESARQGRTLDLDD
jgi:predicted dehydrogenase